MKTFIISRAGEVDRREFQAQQMARLGIEFEFLDAVEASSFSDEECQMAARSWPGVTLPPDIACFHSHREAWRRIVSLGELVLVLEDDAVLAESIHQVLNAIAMHHKSPMHAYDLEYTPERHIVSTKATWSDAGISCRRIYRNRVGTAGYVFGPEVARRMLKETLQYRLIDSYMWQRSWLHAQQIEPAQVVQMRFLPGREEKQQFIRETTWPAFRNSSKLRNSWLRLKIECARGRSILVSVLSSRKRLLGIDFSKFNLS